jgi:hypothetical protein
MITDGKEVSWSGAELLRGDGKFLSEPTSKNGGWTNGEAADIRTGADKSATERRWTVWHEGFLRFGRGSPGTRDVEANQEEVVTGFKYTWNSSWRSHYITGGHGNSFCFCVWICWLRSSIQAIDKQHRNLTSELCLPTPEFSMDAPILASRCCHNTSTGPKGVHNRVLS